MSRAADQSPTSRALRTLVGVLMVVGGEVVGVLHIGTYDVRHFGEEDVSVLQLVADRAALATQASQRHAERTATLALQRSLPPTRLPIFEGVELAARYVPGHKVGVGGDWYDAHLMRVSSAGHPPLLGVQDGTASVSGRGFALMRACTDRVELRDRPGGGLTDLCSSGSDGPTAPLEARQRRFRDRALRQSYAMGRGGWSLSRNAS